MSDYSKMTYDALLQAELAQVSSDVDKRTDSLIYTACAPAAYIVSDFYYAMGQAALVQNLSTAVGSALDNFWGAVSQTQRIQASAAVRLGVFNIDVPIGSRFSTLDNALNFVATEQVSTGQYQMTCETPGSAGNDYSGAILPITTIQGLTSAQLTEIIIPGQDTESDDAYRARILQRLQTSNYGGNVATYQDAIIGISGVGAVQIYPTYNGGGTVLCSIIGADYAPASEELVQEVQNAIDPPPNQGLGYGVAPIGATVTITTATALTVNVSATLTLASGYEIGQVQTPVETAIESYLTSVAKEWGTPITGQVTGYSQSVYLARVTAAILTVPGVENATNVQLNGGTADLTLTETSALQQIPQIGTVTLSAS